MKFSACRRGEIHEGVRSFLPLPWIVHRGDWKGLRQAFSPLWSYSPAERTYVSGIKKARLRRRLWPSVGGRLCRRVMKEKVQRVVVSHLWRR